MADIFASCIPIPTYDAKNQSAWQQAITLFNYRSADSAKDFYGKIISGFEKLKNNFLFFR